MKKKTMMNGKPTVTGIDIIADLTNRGKAITTMTPGRVVVGIANGICQRCHIDLIAINMIIDVLTMRCEAR